MTTDGDSPPVPAPGNSRSPAAQSPQQRQSSGEKQVPKPPSVADWEGEGGSSLPPSDLGLFRGHRRQKPNS